MPLVSAEVLERPVEDDSIEAPAGPTSPAPPRRFVEEVLLVGPTVEVESPLAVGDVDVIADEALARLDEDQVQWLVGTHLPESEREDVARTRREERAISSSPRQHLVGHLRGTAHQLDGSSEGHQ